MESKKKALMQMCDRKYMFGTSLHLVQAKKKGQQEFFFVH